MMGRNLFANEAKPQGRNLLPGGKQESFQDQALKLGATPGVALTPEQVEMIKRGEQITPNQPQLTQGTYKPAQTENENAFLSSGKQEMKNIGAGIIRTFAELGNALGYENARQLLNELETSQNMDMAQTERNTEGHPIQSFAGGVTGGTLAFPAGGGSGGLISRILTGSASGAVGGALSATGRGEEGTAIAEEAALGGIFGAAGEGAPSLLKKVKAKRAAKDLDQLDVDSENISDLVSNIEIAKEASKQTGIDLLPAQSTLDPFQKEMTAFLGQNPEVSKKALKTLKTQNQQASDAVSNLLNQIATPEQFSASPGMGRKAAKTIVENARKKRANVTNPLYKEAFNLAEAENFIPDISNVKSKIDSILSGAFDSSASGNPIQRNVLRAAKMIGDKPTMKQLQTARFGIDDMLDNSRDSVVGSHSKRYLTEIREEITNSLRTFQPFADADEVFKQMSPDVDKVKDGIFGRIADLPDKDLKRVSAIIFDPSEINSKETVANAVKALKGVDGGEDVARGLLRVELEKRMSKLPEALDEMQLSDDMKNAPAALKRAIFGNAKQQEMLFSALEEIDPKHAKNAVWLKAGLDRAMQARPGGSQTGIRNVISDKFRNMRQGVVMAVWNFFRHPIDSVTDIGAEAAFNRKVRAVGEALYNPDWQPDMNRLKKLDPTSAKAKSEFEKLLTKIATTTSDMRTQAAAVSGRSLNDEEED